MAEERRSSFGRVVKSPDMKQRFLEDDTPEPSPVTPSPVRGQKKPRMSMSERSGLQFPVPSTKLLIRDTLNSTHKRTGGVAVSDNAAVFLTAVAEYMTAEILELSGNAAKDNKRHRIKNRDLLLAIDYDWELTNLFEMNDVANGGVLPNIHAVLLPKPKPPKAKRTAAPRPVVDMDDDSIGEEMAARVFGAARCAKGCMSIKGPRGYGVGIKKVLKQVHPETGITGQACQTVMILILSMLERVLQNVRLLSAGTSGHTFSARDMYTGVLMTIPGELAKHAIAEGNKCVTKFTESK